MEMRKEETQTWGKTECEKKEKFLQKREFGKGIFLPFPFDKSPKSFLLLMN
jgi:hypothetical protein